jgi:hypothetical protein
VSAECLLCGANLLIAFAFSEFDAALDCLDALEAVGLLLQLCDRKVRGVDGDLVRSA